MKRVYNFSPGPSALPVEVLEKARNELLSYQDAGMSVMEMSHRSKVYINIIESAEELLRELMNIPKNYKVLFLQGGASLQFSMVPMNLFKTKKADYMNTGAFASKAIAEAGKIGEVNVVASSKDKLYSYIPDFDRSKFNPSADYFHITFNNTIYGTKFTKLPDVGGVPLVTDASSAILSEEIDVSKFGLIYAGAQKNMGPAGATVVIVREDLIGAPLPGTPAMLDYKIQAGERSLYNTPSTFAVYVLKLVLEWLKDFGGVSAIYKRNLSKAKLLYDYLDESAMFTPTANKKDRSLMNITFVTGDADLDAVFVKEAEQNGLANLKGHRSVGGMRASIYNAMDEYGVTALVNFMKEFEVRYRV